MTSVTEIERAARKAAGVKSNATVEAGQRLDRRGACESTPNELNWHDPDSSHGDLFDVTRLTKADLIPAKLPAVFDLYVHTGPLGDTNTELETNVCAVVAADGELIACFDSVSHFRWLAWWLEGTACACPKCITLPPLPPET